MINRFSLSIEKLSRFRIHCTRDDSQVDCSLNSPTMTILFRDGPLTEIVVTPISGTFIIIKAFDDSGKGEIEEYYGPYQGYYHALKEVPKITKKFYKELEDANRNSKNLSTSTS